MATTINYHLLARKFIIIPLVIILLVGTLVHIAGDLLVSTKNEITNATIINKLLAKSITTKNSMLISQQVQQVLATSPQYESIMYYPLQNNLTIPPTNFSNYTLLFAPTVSLNEPVTPYLLDNNNAASTTANSSQNINGYINLTLDLKKIRLKWMKQNFVTLLTVFLIWLVTLAILLNYLRKLTKRLPVLEDISKKVLLNQPVTSETYHNLDKPQSPWLFEQALIHLVNTQKSMSHQISQLQADNQLALADKSKLIRQNSNFQNTLSYEFKVSINRIESGIQLLKNQYISREQEDAVETINQGVDELNSKLNQIIQYTRIEKGQAAIQLSQFNPTTLIETIVEQNQSYAHEKALTLTAKVYHADYVLEGDVQKISIILNSLIENAIQFTEDGSIQVISKLQHLEKNIRWTIQVIDTGIGIQKNHIEHLFDPFFQINKDIKHSHNSQTVGLFLVDKMVSILDGQISVESELNRGSTFTVNLNLLDWKEHYERNLLKDAIISYWGDDDYLNPLYQRLIDTGALVQGYDDSELLIEYLMTHRVDILLISPTKSFQEVLVFIKHLRSIESSHRILTVYYYDDEQLTLKQYEELSIEGMDYFNKLEVEQSQTDELVKRLIQYLN